MFLDKISPQSDLVGAAASGLCAIHCIATPFLFVAQSCSTTGCCEGPIWWSMIDYFFIGVTFLAVYYSSGDHTPTWMKYGLYGSWILLSALILNEKMALLAIPALVKYTVAFALIGLHLYNRKYCCASDTCLATS